MKKWMWICCVPVLLTGCATQKISQTSIIPEAKGWRAAYRQVLYEFQRSDNYTEHAAFSLYDISGDGVPELILSLDSCHAASCRIVTYQDKAVDVGEIGSFGECCYNSDQNLILSGYLGQGVQHSIFYRLQNGVLQEIIKFYNDEGYRGIEDAVFRINDVEVSKAEYDQMYQFYESGAEWIYLGRDYQFGCIDAAFSRNCISRSEACERLREKLDWDFSIFADSARLYQGRYCYILQTTEVFPDHNVTTGWYAVDMQTGECFDTQTLTSLVPLETKK